MLLFFTLVHWVYLYQIWILCSFSKPGKLFDFTNHLLNLNFPHLQKTYLSNIDVIIKIRRLINCKSAWRVYSTFHFIHSIGLDQDPTKHNCFIVWSTSSSTVQGTGHHLSHHHPLPLPSHSSSLIILILSSRVLPVFSFPYNIRRRKIEIYKELLKSSHVWQTRYLLSNHNCLVKTWQLPCCGLLTLSGRVWTPISIKVKEVQWDRLTWVNTAIKT